MKRKKDRMLKKIIFLVICLLLIGQVSAFAISSAYYEGNPLKMEPGEMRDFIMFLQNTKDTNIEVTAKISTGSEIVQITNPSNIYSVPATGKSIVNLKAKVPTDAKVGEVHTINIKFATVNNPTEEFGFGSAINQKFEILITNKDGTMTKQNNYIWIILIVLGIITIITGIIISTKKKKLGNFKY